MVMVKITLPSDVVTKSSWTSTSMVRLTVCKVMAMAIVKVSTWLVIGTAMARITLLSDVVTKLSWTSTSMVRLTVCKVMAMGSPFSYSSLTIVMQRTGTKVRLEPDVAEMFPSADAVNEALRFLIRVMRDHQASTPTTR